MKIVEAKLEKSKSDKMREIVRSIAGDNKKAVFVESESDLKLLCKIVRDNGFKPKTRKLSSGGWKVWINC